MKPSVESPIAYSADGKRLLALRPREATVLVANGYGEWRGRKQGNAVTTLVTKNALLLFIGQMRFKERLQTTSLDSKTHASYSRDNPWKGVRHVRNEHYAEPIATRLNLQYTDGSHSTINTRR
jgi:hypothetical protein